jgi:hypothetical protein
VTAQPRRLRRAPLVAVLALTVAPSACGELLGADAPEELSEAGAILDASRDAPVDAAPDRKTHPDAALDASGVALLVDPSQIVFTAPVGSAAAPSPQTALVVNAGTAPSPPLSASVQLDTTDFYVMQSSCSMALQPDASCSVTVGARASATGQTAALKVGGDGVYAYASILGPPGTGLEFTPGSCLFPATDVGSISHCGLYLVNNGSTTLPAPTLSIVQPAPAFAFDNGPPSCQSPFLPGSSCAIALSFEPPLPNDAPYLGTLTAAAGADVATAALLGGTTQPEDDGGTADTGSPDGGPPPPPPLLPGPGWNILGSEENRIIAWGNPAGVDAVSLSGSTTPITGFDPLPVIETQIADDTVFLWLNTGTDLTVWTPATGPQAVSTSSAPIFDAAYGNVVFFLDGWDATTATANLDEVTLGGPDGGSAPQVIAVVTLSSASPTAFDPCTPRWQSTSSRLYLGACIGGTGPFDESLWSFDGTGGAVPIATGIAPGWGADSAGDLVFVATSAGIGQVIGPSGNLVTTLDTGVTEGAMLLTGSQAVYVARGALWVNDVSANMPGQLADSAAGLWGLSPDGTYALYYDTARTSTSPLGPTGDIWLASTDVAIPMSFELTAEQDAVPWVFTADESHVSWVVPTSGAMSYATTIASTVTGMTTAGPLALHPQGLPQGIVGATLLYQQMGADPNTPDLHALDTSSSTDTLLASGTNPGFVWLDPTLAAYATDQGSAAGVYLVQVPP